MAARKASTNGVPRRSGYRPSNRVVPKGTRLADLRKVGGMDLGIYYHWDETYKWNDIEYFRKMIQLMETTLRRLESGQLEPKRGDE